MNTMPNPQTVKTHTARRLVGKVLQFLFIVSAAYSFAHIRWCIGNLFSEYWTKAWGTLITGILHLNIGLGKRLARDIYIISYVLWFIPGSIAMANAFAAGFYRGEGPATWPMYLVEGIVNALFLVIMFWCIYGWPMRDVFQVATEKEDSVQQNDGQLSSESALSDEVSS